jgi:tRNA-Thr(GGU) m(6)t(6)A37 methyltransferase TsaA
MTMTQHMSMKVTPIGVVRSSLTKAEGSPIQPVFAEASEGVVEVYEPYREGLKDLDGFERIWLIYWFDRAAEPKLTVRPYLDNTDRGLFATRAPCRPNPIGLSAVRLLRITEGRVHVGELDVLDGTPLLDIKPYVGKFDCFEVRHNGWLDTVNKGNMESDGRFYKNQKSAGEAK